MKTENMKKIQDLTLYFQKGDKVMINVEGDYYYQVITGVEKRHLSSRSCKVVGLPLMGSATLLSLSNTDVYLSPSGLFYLSERAATNVKFQIYGYIEKILL